MTTQMKLQTSLTTRAVALTFALVTTASVLGATVFGMQPHYAGAAPSVVALDSVTVTATRVN